MFKRCGESVQCCRAAFSMSQTSRCVSLPYIDWTSGWRTEVMLMPPSEVQSPYHNLLRESSSSSYEIYSAPITNWHKNMVQNSKS